MHQTSELADQLQTAMKTRAVIEQAKDIVMIRERCDREQASKILVQTSQRRNLRLNLLAQAIVENVSTGADHR